ncbi:hypothetical protein [Nitrosomonas sp. wSCUT-2]
MFTETYFWKKIIISLPVSFDRVSMYPFIDAAITSQNESKAGKVVFDLRKLKTITPTGVIVFSNLIEFFKKNRVRVEFENYESKFDAISFLDDVGFFKLYVGQNLERANNSKFKNMPLELIAKDDYIGYVHFQLIPWIAMQARLGGEGSLAPLRSCIEEVFLNINDHSGVDMGCTYTQFDPKELKMTIAVSDFGRTIPAVVRENNPSLKLLDHEAIGMAWKEGFTTKSNVRNRGAGLHNLIQYVTQQNDGTILIASGRGEISAVKHTDSYKVIARPSRGYYPGTLVRIILKTNNFDKFMEDTKEEQFKW